MTDSATLLPPASTPLERNLSRTMGRFNPPSIVPGLWNPDTCPPSILPYLAWALSVDEWDNGWPIEKKREVVKAAREIHQKKGTPLAIARALESIGQPDAVLIERADCIRRDGSRRHDGTGHRRGLDGWATRRIILNRQVTIDQAFQIKRLLEAVGRNCVHTTAIDYAQAALRRNGVAARDGSYTRGVVNTSLT